MFFPCSREIKEAELFWKNLSFFCESMKRNGDFERKLLETEKAQNRLL